MKTFLLLGLASAIFCSSLAMTPQEVAVSLLACPAYNKIDPGDTQNAARLMVTLQRVAEEDIQTIREGLRIYQDIVTSADFEGTETARGAALTVPILFKVMFEFPKGRLADFRSFEMSFQSGDQKPFDPQKIMEFSVPVDFDEHGKMKLGWFFAGYTGHLSYDFTTMLDHHLQKYPLRRKPEPSLHRG